MRGLPTMVFALVAVTLLAASSSAAPGPAPAPAAAPAATPATAPADTPDTKSAHLKDLQTSSTFGFGYGIPVSYYGYPRYQYHSHYRYPYRSYYGYGYPYYSNYWDDWSYYYY